MTNTPTHAKHPVASRASIGFIGIGNMGFAMMARLLAQGWSVAVHDIDPLKLTEAQSLGATPCHSAAEVATQCSVTFIVVVDAAQVDQVMTGDRGLWQSAQAGDTVFLCPTLGPKDVIQFAEQTQSRGISLIDAPMSGGPVRAREGQMSLMLAGNLSVLHAHQALLDAITTHRFLIGETPGDAAKTKLANNLLAAINLAGASEVLAMAQSWGLDPQTTLNVMQASSGQSWIGQDRLTRALQNDFEPRAHTSLLTKDTRLALEACEWLQVSTPALGAMAAQQFALACEQGFTEKDDASLFLFAGGKPKQD
jgi:3-hydroxyisobutyrate dehydrogenase